jgi:hypothetical protein
MREEGPGDRAQKGTPRRGHGEGGIRKRPDGRWEATVDLGYQVARAARNGGFGSLLMGGPAGRSPASSTT